MNDTHNGLSTVVPSFGFDWGRRIVNGGAKSVQLGGVKPVHFM